MRPPEKFSLHIKNVCNTLNLFMDDANEIIKDGMQHTQRLDIQLCANHITTLPEFMYEAK